MTTELPVDVSDLFRDAEAEKKLLNIMKRNPTGFWNVSEFVRSTGLTRPRVDRAVVALEAEHRISAGVLGRSKVIRFIPNGDAASTMSRVVRGSRLEKSDAGSG